MQHKRFARVIVDRSADREFDYLIPEALQGKVGIGSRVRLPFRNRAALGTVVDVLDESAVPEASLRPLNAVIGDKPIRQPGIDRTRPVDGRLLLLPSRDGDAQCVASGDP